MLIIAMTMTYSKWFFKWIQIILIVGCSYLCLTILVGYTVVSIIITTGGSNVVQADLELYIAKNNLELLISLHSPQVHYYYFKIVFFNCMY